MTKARSKIKENVENQGDQNQGNQNQGKCTFCFSTEISNLKKKLKFFSGSRVIVTRAQISRSKLEHPNLNDQKEHEYYKLF